MCDIINDWDWNELINHPKLSDEFKYKFFQDIINEDEFCNWFEGLNNLGIPIGSLGLTNDMIDNRDYIWGIDDEDYGIPSQNIAFSKKEEFRTINLYRYISTEYGPSNIGKNTRRFCKMLVSRTNAALMRFEDIVRLNSSNPGLGKGGSDTYSVFEWRGGANCKHVWVKYKYDETTRNLVKAPIIDQPTNKQVNGKVPYANGTNFPPPRK
jgi:hypothetical protein